MHLIVEVERGSLAAFTAFSSRLSTNIVTSGRGAASRRCCGATQAACTAPGAYWDSAAQVNLFMYRPCQEKWCEGSNVATYSQSDGDAVVNGMSSANWGQYSGPNGASDWYFWGEDFASVEDCQTAAEALSGSAIAEIWYVPPYPGCPPGSCNGYCFPSESRCTNGDTMPSGPGNKYYYNDI